MTSERWLSLGGAFLLGAIALAQRPGRPDRLLAQMTLDEKLVMLHGASEPPGGVGQAGYLPGVPRLGIPPLRLTDGPAGVRTQLPATAMPAPIALAATWSPDLARQYGRVLGHDARARNQDVLLAPMVNIVRVPQAGRNFETLGEDPLLAGRMVADEIAGIQSEGVIATVKHFAENNQETQRQSVSADVDERTMHEIELPGFEAAVRAGVGAVMASYNKVNGTYASENAMLESDILRGQWKFDGFVMSDWGATHTGAPALNAGLDMEMPSGRNFAALADAIKAGTLQMDVVDRAVRRILTSMDRAGLLDQPAKPRPTIDVDAESRVAREIAEAGAVLLKNERHALPLAASDLKSIAVIGPTGRTLLVGGGGSAKVLPFHTGSVLASLETRAGAKMPYAIGYDVEGVVVPGTSLDVSVEMTSHDGTIVFDGPPTPIDNRLPAAQTMTWRGTITAPATGDYELKLQTSGGRGSLQIDPPPPSAGATAGGRAGGARGGGRGAGGGTTSLLPTADGLSNATTRAYWNAGEPHRIVVTATAAATTPMRARLAWVTPERRAQAIAEAVAAAKSAKAAVVFAYDESSEGRDQPSLALPGDQDALIAAVAAANPRTIVVLNNGAPVLMPWADDVAAILQMWYPGQDGAEATAAILTGEANPSGRLPETFPRRAEDAPTAPPERYPGVNGRGEYSEGIFVGYRWYDAQKVAPLFPFGHGLSYTTFVYSDLSAKTAGEGVDVSFTVKNTGTRAGTDVPQIYAGAPASPPIPMAVRALAGFARVALGPGRSQRVTIHIDARAWSYWSVAAHAWTVAPGARSIELGASSRDITLRTTVTK